jgi:hypothetical protein
MQSAVVFIAIGLVATSAFAATQTPATKKSHSRSTRHSAIHSRSHSRQGKRNVQAAPTQQRYQEIQQALASRGYYRGTVNGTWNSDSADALKRFQADQNLAPDGKLTPLSLVAMGLGPKRASGTAPATGPATTHPAAQPPSSSSAPPATSVSPITVQQSNPAPASPAPADAH